MKIARLFSFNLFFLALGLAAAELAFGNWIAPNPAVNLNLLKGVEYRFDVSHLYGKAGDEAIYRRDHHGLRGMAGDPSGIDLLTLGGSTTDQRYLSEGQTWQDIMEEDLIRSGKKMEIVNAGLDGQSTVGEIRDFDLWFTQVPNLRARFILLYNGINDLFSERTGPYDDLSGTHSLKGMIRARSVLYHLYQQVRGNLLARFKYPVSHRKIDFERKSWTTEPLQTDHATLLEKKLESYRQNLMILDEKIRALGAIPIFVTQPSQMFRRDNDQIRGVTDTMMFGGKPVNGVDFYLMLTLINETTMASCRELKGICIDLAQDLSFEEGNFYDYFHTTPSGAEKIGHYLFKKLKNAV